LNEDTGLAPAGPIGVFTLDTRERPVEVLNGTVVSLCSFEPTNYGAFLFRVLPKLAGRQDILAKHRILAPLYNNAMRDLFQMAGISAERIVAHNTHVISLLSG
jgi:capsular polysaccharide biosynthesis protein